MADPDLAVLAIGLVPILAGAQEENQGYDKTNPIVLTVDQEYSGTTHSDHERKYLMAHVEADAEHRLDMTGLSADLDIYYLGSDDRLWANTAECTYAWKCSHPRQWQRSSPPGARRMSDTKSPRCPPIRPESEVTYEGQVGSRSSLYELGGLTVGSDLSKSHRISCR